MKKLFVGLLLLAFVLAPSLSSADTKTLNPIEQWLERLRQLSPFSQSQTETPAATQELFQSAASVQSSLAIEDDYGTGTDNSGTAGATYCPRLSTTFQRGARDSSTNGQVSELQRFLSDYYDLDPEEIISGFFGRITQGYVQQFQREQGLPAFGIVGSLTRAAIARVCGGEGTTIPPAGSIIIETTSDLAAYVGTYFQARFTAFGGSGEYDFDAEDITISPEGASDGLEDYEGGQTYRCPSCTRDQIVPNDSVVVAGTPRRAGVISLTLIARDARTPRDTTSSGRARFSIVIRERDATTPPTKLISEQVRCVFKGSTSLQKCYTAGEISTGRYECDGYGRNECLIYITGKTGEQVTWKSTCGGYGYNTINGVNDTVSFDCSSTPPPTSYPGFLMSTDKPSYLPNDTAILTLSRADGKDEPFALDIVAFKTTSTNESEVETLKSGVPVGAKQEVPLMLGYYKVFSQGAGEYGIALRASGQEPSNKNSITISIQSVSSPPSTMTILPVEGSRGTFTVGGTFGTGIIIRVPNKTRGTVSVYLRTQNQGINQLLGEARYKDNRGIFILSSPVIPDVPTASNYLFVTDSTYDDAGRIVLADMSDEPFSIVRETVTPTITVISPNGGERWVDGVDQRISWRPSVIENPKLPRIDLYITNTNGTYAVQPSINRENTGWDTWTPRGVYGTFKVKICKTGTNDCDESDAPFSILSAATPPTTLPDLTISQVGIQGTLTAGTAVTILGNIQNYTDSSAGAFTARICLDYSDCLTSTDGRLGPDEAMPPLAARAISTSISRAWTATAGRHTAYLCADVELSVAESNEANNCLSHTFVVADSSTPPTTPTPPQRPQSPFILYGPDPNSWPVGVQRPDEWRQQHDPLFWDYRGSSPSPERPQSPFILYGPDPNSWPVGVQRPDEWRQQHDSSFWDYRGYQPLSQSGNTLSRFLASAFSGLRALIVGSLKSREESAAAVIEVGDPSKPSFYVTPASPNKGPIYAGMRGAELLNLLITAKGETLDLKSLAIRLEMTTTGKEPLGNYRPFEDMKVNFYDTKTGATAAGVLSHTGDSNDGMTAYFAGTVTTPAGYSFLIPVGAIHTILVRANMANLSAQNDMPKGGVRLMTTWDLDNKEGTYGIGVSSGQRINPLGERLNIEPIVAAPADSPFIQITVPNGGESWAHGKDYAIRWAANAPKRNVRIELWKNGLFHSYVANAVPVKDGSYTWTPHFTVSPAADYKIKLAVITEPADTARGAPALASDESDTPFGIAFANGNLSCIFTLSKGIPGAVFSMTGGAASSLDCSQHCNSVSESAKGATGVCKYGSTTISIAPQMQVLSPSGKLIADKEYRIIWSTNLTASYFVRIELWKSDELVKTIAFDISASQEEYIWIPRQAQAGTGYFVRVSAVKEAGQKGLSAPFITTGVGPSFDIVKPSKLTALLGDFSSMLANVFSGFNVLACPSPR